MLEVAEALLGVAVILLVLTATLGVRLFFYLMENQEIASTERKGKRTVCYVKNPDLFLNPEIYKRFIQQGIIDSVQLLLERSEIYDRKIIFLHSQYGNYQIMTENDSVILSSEISDSMKERQLLALSPTVWRLHQTFLILENFILGWDYGLYLKKVKRYILWQKFLASAVLLMIISVILFGYYRNNGQYGNQSSQITIEEEQIQRVKGGCFNNYPDQKIGESFERFFDEPKWRFFIGQEDGDDKEAQDVVEFTGYCTYRKVRVKVLMQFILGEGEGFEVGYVSFNEVPQVDLITAGLIQAIFELENEETGNEKIENKKEAFIEGIYVNTRIYDDNPSHIKYNGEIDFICVEEFKNGLLKFRIVTENINRDSVLYSNLIQLMVAEGQENKFEYMDQNGEAEGSIWVTEDKIYLRAEPLFGMIGIGVIEGEFKYYDELPPKFKGDSFEDYYSARQFSQKIIKEPVTKKTDIATLRDRIFAGYYLAVGTTETDLYRSGGLVVMIEKIDGNKLKLRLMEYVPDGREAKEISNLITLNLTDSSKTEFRFNAGRGEIGFFENRNTIFIRAYFDATDLAWEGEYSYYKSLGEGLNSVDDLVQNKIRAKFMPGIYVNTRVKEDDPRANKYNGEIELIYLEQVGKDKVRFRLVEDYMWTHTLSYTDEIELKIQGGSNAFRFSKDSGTQEQGQIEFDTENGTIYAVADEFGGEFEYYGRLPDNYNVEYLKNYYGY